MHEQEDHSEEGEQVGAAEVVVVLVHVPGCYTPRGGRGDFEGSEEGGKEGGKEEGGGRRRWLQYKVAAFLSLASTSSSLSPLLLLLLFF